MLSITSHNYTAVLLHSVFLLKNLNILMLSSFQELATLKSLKYFKTILCCNISLNYKND